MKDSLIPLYPFLSVQALCAKILNSIISFLIHVQRSYWNSSPSLKTFFLIPGCSITNPNFLLSPAFPIWPQLLLIHSHHTRVQELFKYYTQNNLIQNYQMMFLSNEFFLLMVIKLIKTQLMIIKMMFLIKIHHSFCVQNWASLIHLTSSQLDYYWHLPVT